MALGYIFSRTSSKLLKTDISIPIVLTLSVVPDIDMVIPFLEHRGPTHSVIISLIVFTPVLVLHKKRAIPYLLALAQHSLLGDFLGGGKIQLVWPATMQFYGLSTQSHIGILLEWVSFLLSMIIMVHLKDVQKSFLQPNNSNLMLIIPALTILLPILFKFPLGVPSSLIIQHLAFMCLLAASIITSLFTIQNPLKGHPSLK